MRTTACPVNVVCARLTRPKDGKRYRKRRDVVVGRSSQPSVHPPDENPAPPESPDVTSRNTRVSNLITIVCTLAGVSPVFLREKFVAAAILFVFGVVSMLYAV